MKSPLVTLLLICTFGGGSPAIAMSRNKSECQFQTEDYMFTKSPDDMRRDFARRNVEEQYELFICGSQYIHPPALHLAGVFAYGGEPVALFLSGKLSTAQNDLVIRDILRVFAAMKRQKTYNIAANKQLMSLIELKAKSVTHAVWRDVVMDLLKEIQN